MSFAGLWKRIKKIGKAAASAIGQIFNKVSDGISSVSGFIEGIPVIGEIGKVAADKYANVNRLLGNTFSEIGDGKNVGSAIKDNLIDYYKNRNPITKPFLADESQQRFVAQAKPLRDLSVNPFNKTL